jgi:hypothetical protein
MESNVKSPALVMRVLKYAFVMSAFMFIYIAIEIPVQPNRPVSMQLQMAIAFVGFMSIVAGFFLPRILFQAAECAPQNNSAEAELGRWMTKGIISLAFFNACNLFGLVLHFLHGSVRLVELLFGAGIAAELFWSPGAPPNVERGEFQQN